MKNVRTRFAPSPTGYLHIGGLRTALFTYLIAKKYNGKFILRIEDTDQERKVEGAVKSLISILKWLGLEFDEGPVQGGNFGPYTQTDRLEIYNRHKDILLDSGHAYRCFCTPERLKKMRQDQQNKKQAPRYDRACRSLSAKEIEEKLANREKYVVRQAMPLEGETRVNDEIRGEIKFNNKDLDDHVLVKSSGIPTYQFANVVDDHTMEISHVTRGEEWIPSFPKNILLYQAFGWEPPKFIHYPVILNKTGGKLSKRQGDVAVEDFKARGYVPAALINFCSLLGWHPKTDNEILSLNDIIKVFDIKDINPSPSIFEVDKLDFFNGYWLRQKSASELVKLIKPFLKDNIKLSSEAHKKEDAFLRKIISIEKERIKKLSDIAEITDFFFVEELKYGSEMLVWKKMDKSSLPNNLQALARILEKIPEENWTNDSIEEGVMSFLKAKELKIGEFLWPMRVALTGRKASPGPFEVAEILGKKETLKKINVAIKRAQSLSN